MRPRHPSLSLSNSSWAFQHLSIAIEWHRSALRPAVPCSWAVPPPGVLVPCTVAVATQSHRGELNTSQRRTPPAHPLGAITFPALDLGIHDNSLGQSISASWIFHGSPTGDATKHQPPYFARATLRLHHASRRIASHCIASPRIPQPSLTPSPPPLQTVAVIAIAIPQPHRAPTSPRNSINLRACLRSASLSPQ